MDIFENRCKWLRTDKKTPCNFSIIDNQGHNSLCDLQWQFRCTEWQKRHEPSLSHSSIKDYVLCRRKYWYSQIQGIKLIKTPVKMMLGRIAAEILEKLHSKKTGDFDYKDVINQYKTQFAEEYGSDKLPTALIAMEAFFNAYIDLGYHEVKGETEYRFEIQEPDYPHITGYLDMLTYEAHIGHEFKYTGSPGWYDLFTVKEQLGMYFLGVPDLSRISLRLLVRPQFKMAKNEEEEGYKERIYNDMKDRPTFYIRDKSFWRNEFDEDVLLERLKIISGEIVRYCQGGIESFYPSIPPVCFQVEERRCEFLDICNSGTISEGLYQKKGFSGRPKKEDKKEDKENEDIWA